MLSCGAALWVAHFGVFGHWAWEALGCLGRFQAEEGQPRPHLEVPLETFCKAGQHCWEQKLPDTWRGLWTSEHVQRREHQLAREGIMSTAGIAAPEMRVPLKSSFLHNGEGVGSLKTCWSGHGGFENSFFNIDSVTTAYDLSASAPHHLTPIGVGPGSSPEDSLIPGFSRLSVNPGCASDETPPHTPVRSGAPPFPERSARPLPPLPIAEDFWHDDLDKEVEFLTSSDTDCLLGESGTPPFKPTAQGRRSFRGCGQINYAYFDAPTAAPASEDSPSVPDQGGSTVASCPPQPPPSHQLHRRLRRSHSGPAGSFHKPVPDYRRWSAEVTSSAYSDEDKPPKVPPREPLSRSNSRTPSPKSLPSYLNGIMPPTQSFAPDPKYVSMKALQRQHSEGSTNKIPCILPIIENGKKVSSTHYYLLPERPPYLDKYEKFFREAEEGSLSVAGQPWGEDAGATRLDLKAKADLVGPVKRKHLPCMVSP
ncbi:hypothetical protein lerEdw1_001058 [Lerista edwardsae]|nr:hypothetical protein lerEdw1_001058 [Lerista edwardsae]